MKTTRFINANKYYQRVKSYLLQDEANHCLLLGLSTTLVNSPSKDNNLTYLVTVERHVEIAAAAMQTNLDRKLILSKSINTKAINLIAKDVVLLNKSLPGVIGEKDEAITFARTWQSLTGQSFELAVAMKIHQLKKVQPITPASGNIRSAAPRDRSLLVEWSKAFESEALGKNEPKSDYELWFDRHLKQQSLFVWEDKVPVSMAAFGGATPNGTRINAVYTPAKYRSKGYATSCVATLSQQLLDLYKYCFLFTDAANPTSNRIYQKIGYQLVCDISNYNFSSIEGKYD